MTAREKLHQRLRILWLVLAMGFPPLSVSAATAPGAVDVDPPRPVPIDLDAAERYMRDFKAEQISLSERMMRWFDTKARKTFWPKSRISQSKNRKDIEAGRSGETIELDMGEGKPNRTIRLPHEVTDDELRGPVDVGGDESLWPEDRRRSKYTNDDIYDAIDAENFQRPEMEGQRIRPNKDLPKNRSVRYAQSNRPEVVSRRKRRLEYRKMRHNDPQRMEGHLNYDHAHPSRRQLIRRLEDQLKRRHPRGYRAVEVLRQYNFTDDEIRVIWNFMQGNQSLELEEYIRKNGRMPRDNEFLNIFRKRWKTARKMRRYAYDPSKFEAGTLVKLMDEGNFGEWERQQILIAAEKGQEGKVRKYLNQFASRLEQTVVGGHRRNALKEGFARASTRFKIDDYLGDNTPAKALLRHAASGNTTDLYRYLEDSGVSKKKIQELFEALQKKPIIANQAKRIMKSLNRIRSDFPIQMSTAELFAVQQALEAQAGIPAESRIDFKKFKKFIPEELVARKVKNGIRNAVRTTMLPLEWFKSRVLIPPLGMTMKSMWVAGFFGLYVIYDVYMMLSGGYAEQAKEEALKKMQEEEEQKKKGGSGGELTEEQRQALLDAINGKKPAENPGTEPESLPEPTDGGPQASLYGERPALELDLPAIESDRYNDAVAWEEDYGTLPERVEILPEDFDPGVMGAY